MIVFPNAKINIGLNIVGKRADGYHNIETVFYPINLCDIIEFSLSDTQVSSFNCYPPVTSDDDDNLVVKAIKLLKEDFELPAINVDLVKKIPYGAGLGGGSSDASFTLKFLNGYFKLGLSDDELEVKAAKLGADCAFFIKNRPVMATGIGDVFTSVNLSLSGYSVVVVKPDVFVSTKEAFSKVIPHSSARSLMEDVMLPVDCWKEFIVNDFEDSVFESHPEIKEIKDKLYLLGADYASMSGSGSSVYGLFKNIPSDIAKLFDSCYIWASKI